MTEYVRDGKRCRRERYEVHDEEMGEIADKVRDAGVVGAGGAGFPTHVKIGAKADIVIANGAECEPLLRVDQQVMQHYAAQVAEGMRLVMEQTGARRGVIALKDHYGLAIEELQKHAGSDLKLHIMRSYYPAGDEQQIVYEVTGKVVPTGGIPLDVGAVVLNVSTLVNIANAQQGIPVTEKFVTVGGAVKKPVTLNVPVGISAKELVAAAGGVTEDCVYIIGGPCMGKVVEDIDIPVEKTTGGILAIPCGHQMLCSKQDHMSLQMIQAVCCQCTMCTQMCPRNSLGLNVQPHRAMRSIAQGVDLIGGANVNGAFSCCDCGLCTYYACNFGLKPHIAMAKLKAGLTQAGKRAEKEVADSVDNALGTKKLPVARMIARMGLSPYDVPAPMERGLVKTNCVRIPLKMHVGAPSVPVVKPGQHVGKGQLVADIPGQALGAKMHASIDGKVTKMTDTFIEIG